jgi:catechol 2,3-dioxygenase-like lactoylglutathione lyase family enzyme
MAVSAKPIPEGFHTVTPALVVRDAAKAIDFYKRAFGAQELVRMPSPDRRLRHFFIGGNADAGQREIATDPGRLYVHLERVRPQCGRNFQPGHCGGRQRIHAGGRPVLG